MKQLKPSTFFIIPSKSYLSDRLRSMNSISLLLFFFLVGISKSVGQVPCSLLCDPPILEGLATIDLGCSDRLLPLSLNGLLGNVRAYTLDNNLVTSISYIDQPILVNGCKRTVVRTYKVETLCPLPLGRIGGRIWLDENEDGLQDIDEIGLSGIPISLWIDSDRNGVLDISSDTPYLNITTDSNGQYLFLELPSDNYCILVDPLFIINGARIRERDGTTDGVNCLTLAQGEQQLTIDFGIKLPD